MLRGFSCVDRGGLYRIGPEIMSRTGFLALLFRLSVALLAIVAVPRPTLPVQLSSAAEEPLEEEESEQSEAKGEREILHARRIRVRVPVGPVVGELSAPVRWGLPESQEPPPGAAHWRRAQLPRRAAPAEDGGISAA